MLLLAGDIGGTNARLCLVEVEIKNQAISSKTILQQVYASKSGNLVTIVQRFLAGKFQPDIACFALAGPVINNKCKLTNLPWSELAGDTLQKDLNIPQVILINDFVAVAYSIVLEPEKKILTLQKGQLVLNAPIAIIGAGTGLGKALAIVEGNNYRVFPTEGGHQNFSPHNALTDKLLSYLRRQTEPVDVERVVSGRGIVEIFCFLHECVYPDAPSKDILQQNDPALAIAKSAKQGDFLCQKTMEIFVEAYGAAAGDMALNLLPFGGLYIAGGIAAQNLELMQQGKFIQAFKHKARVEPTLLEKIPVYIVLNSLEGLKGAIKYALSQLT